MEIAFYTKGLIIGFSIAAPVGPIGILCVRRSLVGGWTAGLLTGMGAATADALYGCVAGFGLASITGMLVGHREWIQVIGGLFLLYLGLRILRAAAKEAPLNGSSGSAARGYFSTLFLTLTNPLTILSFIAIFAGMGLGRMGSDHVAAVHLVAGVFSGSMAWWTFLALTSSWFGSRLNEKSLVWINRLSGVVLISFGVLAMGALR